MGPGRWVLQGLADLAGGLVDRVFRDQFRVVEGVEVWDVHKPGAHQVGNAAAVASRVGAPSGAFAERSLARIVAGLVGDDEIVFSGNNHSRSCQPRRWVP